MKWYLETTAWAENRGADGQATGAGDLAVSAVREKRGASRSSEEPLAASYFL